MQNDYRDDARRRDTDDLSSSRRDNLPDKAGVEYGASNRHPDDLHDSGRASPDYDANSRLVHLDDVDDFKVADGDPDIRGWDVRTADGRKIGKVEDLIVDTSLMKVRYIEAKLDSEITHSDDNRHVLIPIGTARLDDDEDDVFLSTSIADPHQLPAYDRTHLTRDFEVSLRGYLGGMRADAAGDVDDNFYRHHLYDDASFFGSRRRGRESTSYISPRNCDDRGKQY